MDGVDDLPWVRPGISTARPVRVLKDLMQRGENDPYEFDGLSPTAGISERRPHLGA